VIKYWQMTNKNMKFFLLPTFILVVFLFFNAIFVKRAAAVPLPTYFLNGDQKDVVFNPNNGEEVDIEIRMSEPVKFSRVYICTLDQSCDGGKGNYTRYFSPSTTSDFVISTWNGKGVGDKDVVSEGEYKIAVSFSQGSDTSLLLGGLYTISVDFSSGSTVTSTTTDNTSTSTQATTTQATSTTQTSTSTNATTSTQVITKTVIKYVSLHSSSEDLSDYSDTTKFEISAGRERIGYVGTPIKFSVKNNASKIGNCSSPIFSWTYGDGSKDAGENISHTYKFPGEYNVILNGVCGSESAVSRTKIKILKPEVVFSLISSGDLEISNFGKTEINIGGWGITTTIDNYLFPEDTIISASGKMILPKEYSKIYTEDFDSLSLIDPSKKVVFSLKNNIQKIASSATGVSISVNHPVLNIEVSKDEVEKFTTAFLQNNKKENIGALVVIQTPTNPIDNQDINNTASTTRSSDVATVLESVKSSETKGFWRSLFGLPAKGIKSVAKVFYEVE
jgi:hypothetical protein